MGNTDVVLRDYGWRPQWKEWVMRQKLCHIIIDEFF